MLDGQLATLEPPRPGEESDVVRVVVGHRTAAQLLETVLDLLPASPAQAPASPPPPDHAAVTATVTQPPQ